ncbi:MAG TPA: sensor histidine kinase, partial [Anaerolinea sp.]|nr:sensor histidine kinase [Anaerolinea sp.]
SLLTTALIAALFQPLREQLQRWINHLMYGERDDPYTVLSRLGGRLGTALTPETTLPSIVETIAHSLKLPYVAAALRGPEGELQPAAVYPPGAEEGQPAAGPDALRLPLVYQQEVVGELRLSPRAPGEAFSQQDLRLLADLVRQVGIAAHAVRLTADLRRLTVDLQHSRERLVLAREEERRRIRRDLHDGLGPSLAALALSASSVADLIPTHPQSAAKMAHEMQQEIRASIADIRRLVYELRPPALDELGLVAAIRDRASQVEVTGPTGEGLSVTVDAPGPLTDLPAAVEVAAYRIVLEGLTNVVRHACARTCMIRLDQTTDMLEIEVSDDGVGLPEGYHSGVGLLSMHERAAELGGTCEVTSAPGAGTHVRAKIPL